MTDITPPAVTLIGSPLAPEVFATAATGFFVLNGNIAITFETPRLDHSTEPPGVNPVVVGRLVLPLQGAQGLVVGLNDFLSKHGASPSAAIAQNATKQ